jgi:hypothetical protein
MFNRITVQINACLIAPYQIARSIRSALIIRPIPAISRAEETEHGAPIALNAETVWLGLTGLWHKLLPYATYFSKFSIN